MASRNDITGDLIQSISTKKYQDNYDLIFRKQTVTDTEKIEGKNGSEITQDTSRGCEDKD